MDINGGLDKNACNGVTGVSLLKGVEEQMVSGEVEAVLL